MKAIFQAKQESAPDTRRKTRARTMTILGSMVLSLLILVPAVFADEGGKHGKRTHMKVSGVVSKVQPSHVTIKTPWGQVTVAAAAVPKGLEVGEEVDMWVSENNSVIDVHRKGDPAHQHRYITGNLTYASNDKKEIKLWTPEGEKTFAVQTGRSQLSSLEEGAPVTVELNEAGKVVDIHRFTVEIHFDENPRTKPGNQIEISGVVTKMQSGLIFVKSPVAQYTISAKTAPSDIKVGDEATLWVNEENMVVDHHRKGQDKVHRMISGKLIYAGKTKKEIKLWTPEGEKVFPLERMEVKTKPIAEGSTVIVELNEDGKVVDLRKAP